MKSKLSTAFLENEIERLQNIADIMSELCVHSFTLMNKTKRADIDDETTEKLNQQNLKVYKLKSGIQDIADNLKILKEDANA